MEDDKRRTTAIHRTIDRIDTRIERLLALRNKLQRIADNMEMKKNDHTRKSD